MAAHPAAVLVGPLSARGRRRFANLAYRHVRAARRRTGRPGRRNRGRLRLARPQLAALLDPDTPVPGVTAGPLRPEIAAIAVPATTHGRHMAGDDFALTAGWGHFGAGQAVMPGQGRAVERAYTGAERTHTRPERTHTGAERTVLSAAASVIPAPAGIQPHPPAYEADAGFRVTPSMTESRAAGRQVEDAPFDALGATTYDIHLNDHAYWRNIPAHVWTYRLGGYQVLKKWLSYRERKVLGRDLRPAEVQHFSQTAQRVAAILLLGNGNEPAPTATEDPDPGKDA